MEKPGEFLDDLPLRARNVLLNNSGGSPVTAEWAASLTAKQLSSQPNVGKLTVHAVREALARRGLCFADERKDALGELRALFADMIERHRWRGAASSAA